MIENSSNIKTRGPVEGASENANEKVDFRTLFDFVVKWWLPASLISFIIMSLTALALFRITPVYKATATLEVKQQARQIIEVAGVESVDADDEFLATQIELFKSEALIREVIETAGVLSDNEYIDFTTEDYKDLSRDSKIQLAVAAFRDRLSISLVGASRLIRVNFEHVNPRRAAEIVNALVEEFINNDLIRKQNSTFDARKFLEDRINVVQKSLEISERNLADYATENGIIIISDNDGNGNTSSASLDRTELITLDAKMTVARSEKLEAEERYKAALNNPVSSNILMNTSLMNLNSELTQLQSEYSEKLEYLYPEFPEMLQLRSKIDTFKEAISREQKSLIDASLYELKAELDLANANLNNLDNRVNQLKLNLIDLREKRVEYNILERQVETERTQYDGLLQRLKEISVSDEVGESLVQVVDKAEQPRLPFKPRKGLALLLALVLSGVISFGCAGLLEVMDDRIKSPDDVKKKLKGIVMGVIPFNNNVENVLGVLKNPQSALSESYATVRANLALSGPNGGPKVIHLTSTRSGEGKSLSSLGLASSYGGVTGRVLLIDADMRLPTFSSDSNTSIGLSGLLTSDELLKDHVRTTQFENLSLLSSGSPVPDPVALLSSQRFKDIIKSARESYEYIIIDSPPVLGLADALVLSSVADGTLLIVEAEQIRTPVANATLERLYGGDANVIGVILTKYRAKRHGYLDYYNYSYGQTSDTGDVSGRQRKKSKLAKKKRKLNVI